MNSTLHLGIERSSAGYYSFNQSATLKLQNRIDFKWNRKVVLAVKDSSSSCQIRNTQWRWQIAINYTGHYGQSLSNYSHWAGRMAVIDIMGRPFFLAVDSFIWNTDIHFRYFIFLVKASPRFEHPKKTIMIKENSCEVAQIREMFAWFAAYSR